MTWQPVRQCRMADVCASRWGHRHRHAGSSPTVQRPAGAATPDTSGRRAGGRGPDDYYQALEAIAGWSHCYNYERPHSALNYLRPVDYYRGDPEARLAERERRLAQAVQARAAYWRDHADVVKGRGDPSQN
jgi:hypothetical protein